MDWPIKPGGPADRKRWRIAAAGAADVTNPKSFGGVVGRGKLQ